ncbi:uncharacterized protein LOC106478000 [Limulus polyphemus]|uniref:Uncharacterized protein LOC106478000 n=1 Tax=Limulus polyphemus TaxID=6850 RepID=A0ABM1C4F7_LIMPO|nr:uncharacterized protein LOC106478000 [Limulus polyphemus]
MIHGPCGTLNPNSSCMIDGKCSKRYPRALVSNTVTGNDGYLYKDGKSSKRYSRALVSNTVTGNDGYPLYRRRSAEDGGRLATRQMRNGDIEVDNRWVVPYSSLLSKTYKAHINVEYRNSVKSIKYICKYVNKGSNMAVFGVQPERRDRNAVIHIDEIAQYQAGRYISSNEAV